MRPLPILLSMGSLAVRALAQAPNYCEQRLTASDAQTQDHFGSAVAIDGDTIAIGAPDVDSAVMHAGAVYLYTRRGSGWHEQKLTGSGIGHGDAFGSAVALDRHTLVVGAPSNLPGGGYGSAYAFTESNGVWSELQQLNASDVALYDLFGAAVAIDGDTLLVGSPQDDDIANASGSVYVFARVAGAWNPTVKLHASTPMASALFGYAVALDGDTALVAAPTDGGGAPSRAYVFTRTGGAWIEQQILDTLGPFDASVALDGDTALIASPQFGSGTGIAQAFVRSGTTWSLQQTFAPLDIEPFDGFGGGSIALVGDIAVISSRFDDDGGLNSGSTYVFERSGSLWNQSAKLRASQSAYGDFAGPTAYYGAAIVVGAPYAGHSGQGDAGKAYVFTLTPGIDAYCTGKLNSAGCTPYVRACGSPSASSSSGFELT